MGSNLPEGRGVLPYTGHMGRCMLVGKLKLNLKETNVSHAEWDQNLQFTSLSETTSIPVTLIWGPPDPRVACGHEAFRVMEREWKKGETEKKKQTKTS